MIKKFKVFEIKREFGNLEPYLWILHCRGIFDHTTTATREEAEELINSSGYHNTEYIILEVYEKGTP